MINADNKVKHNIGLYWSKLYPKDFKCFDIPDESADENGDHGGDDDDNEDEEEEAEDDDKDDEDEDDNDDNEDDDDDNDDDGDDKKKPSWFCAPLVSTGLCTNAGQQTVLRFSFIHRQWPVWSLS